MVKHRFLFSPPPAVIASHRAELESLAEARIGELTRQDDRHSAELDELAARLKGEMSDLDAKWSARLLQEVEAKNEELRRAEWAGQQKEEAWDEKRKSLEEQIHALKVSKIRVESNTIVLAVLILKAGCD